KPYQPGPIGVAPMPAAGQGYKIHITGLTHDEKGYPVMTVETQEQMMERITKKITANLDDIIQTESYCMEDAEIAVISYGISSRTAMSAVQEARKMGIKAGMLRLITIWPFPEKQIRQLAQKVKKIVTVEINLGQIFYEVQRCAAGQAAVTLVGHAGGTIIPPERVIDELKEKKR
ncbi:MAG: 2-oxoacid:acceptor oxidoreductase subunit alpha, partial [Proteobacteria bacterium]|nr:2-oxoacid:acceptor oxidoreductase subunit alpha [Pseudomonadota bacterium]